MINADDVAPADPTVPVQAQLDAYNAHDLDAFAACYSDDAQIVDADGTILRDGISEIRAAYAQRFTNPDLHAHLVGRLNAGPWVFDQELVTGLGDQPVSVVAGYLVHDGKIRLARMHR
jgi:hypothetical protein